ncbi:MAG TPA: hypothetical protein VKB27_09390 [Gammaproteobacteria bacterium]|nr:hypothetical protein [Gammaproteobacteria bacterium]
MYLQNLDEVASREKLLTGLNLAIAEARLVQRLIKRRKSPRNLEEVKKLVNVEREIDYLQTTLFELKSNGSP